MRDYPRSRGDDGTWRVEMPLRGRQLLACSLYNKGSAFDDQEREAFGLDGLLPEEPCPMAVQAERFYENVCRKNDPLERYIGMAALMDRNEHLYYRVLTEHLEELLPIVYTPTVGKAAQQFSHIFRRGRGVWITPRHRGRIRDLLRSIGAEGVRLIVATDNEAILGIGDQGAGGMVIPIGKLAIYTAAAGIHPGDTLPVSLDVGTDNESLLDDPMYLGWPHRRLRGEEYFSLMEEFAEAVAEVCPGALLQWEDFRKENAFSLLERFRDRLPSFNDDIQGTGAVALAGLLAGARAADLDLTHLRVVILGAGAAGVGIAERLRHALEMRGVEGDDLLRSIALLDSRGLVTDGRERLEEYKRRVAWPEEMAREAGLDGVSDLLGVCERFRPGVLIGTSGQFGVFDRAVVETVAKHVDRPVILPFSNPTDNSEAVPEDVLRWTDGRALVATGSPFAPVQIGGRTFTIGQGNNAFVFPALGLASLTCGARVVSRAMLTVAAQALADQVTDEDLSRGQLYPSISRLPQVTSRVAEAIVGQAREEGLAPEWSDDEIRERLREAMWKPVYPELQPV